LERELFEDDAIGTGYRAISAAGTRYGQAAVSSGTTVAPVDSSSRSELALAGADPHELAGARAMKSDTAISAMSGRDR